MDSATAETMCQPCLIGDHGCCQDCPCAYCTDADVRRALSRRGVRGVVDWKARAEAAESEVVRLRADNEMGRINLAHYRETINHLAGHAAHCNGRVMTYEWPECDCRPRR